MSSEDDATPLVVGGGEMGATVRLVDWSTTPLGRVEQWPPGLRTALSFGLNAPLPMALWLGPAFVLVYNDAWRPLLGDNHAWEPGRSGREAAGRAWEQLGPLLSEVQATGKAAVFDGALLLKCPCTLSCSPIYDDAGEVLGVLTTATAVGPKHDAPTLRDMEAAALGDTLAAEVSPSWTRTEEQRQQVDAILNAIHQDTPALVAVKDRDSRIVMCSPTVLTSIDRPAAEVIGKTDIDLFGPEQGAKILAHDQQIMRTGVSESFEEHANGRVFYVSKTPYRDPAGAILGLIAIGVDITERKRAEEALRQSEATLSAVLDAVPVGVVIADAAGRLLRVNAALNAIWGVPPETTSWEQYGEWLGYWPETGERIKAHEWAMSRTLLTGEVVQDELVECEQFGSGQRRLFLNNAAPIRDRTGAIVAGVVVELDVTERLAVERERKRAEEAWRRQSELTQTILENSTACMFMMDANGYCTYMNRAGEVMFGWSFEEIRQRPLHDMIHHHHPDGRPYPIAECPIDRALPENFDIREHEDVFIRRSGVFFPVLVAASPIFDATGRPVSTVIEVRDVTERRLAEAATLRRSEQLRQLAQAATRIHAARDVAAIMNIVTEEARALTGAHQAATSTTTGEDWAQVINVVSLSEKYARWRTYAALPDGSGIYALVCRLNAPMRLTQAELEAHPAWRGFGGEAPNHPPMRGWLAVPLVGLDGRNHGLIQLSDKEEGEFTADDEAMLVQLARIASVALENQSLYAQEQAARAQAEEASRLKDEFLATVSHELRTPLTAFLGYAQLLQARKRDEAYVARTVEKMVRSALAQAQLIEDLLDVSRIVSGKLRLELRLMDLIPVIQAALDTVRPSLEAKSLQLHLDLRPEASMVNGDAGRLQQVVWNLLSNAAKFTSPGGMVAVRLEPDGHDARLTVSDTGQGIDPGFLPYMFDRFRQADGTSQRAQGGLGLGLAIVRHLVELHGGTVDGASAGVGCGATFTVRLPLALAADAPALAGEVAGQDDAIAGSPLALRGLRVLLVDDQPDILELLHEVLALSGAMVRTAASAREALAAVRAWRPDVLVSDIAMPGEDGYWLIEQVRALPPEEGGTTPAVALTAYVRLEDRLRVLAAGFQQYVPKPVDPEELRGILGEGLQRREHDHQ